MPSSYNANPYELSCIDIIHRYKSSLVFIGQQHFYTQSIPRKLQDNHWTTAVLDVVYPQGNCKTMQTYTGDKSSFSHSS